VETAETEEDADLTPAIESLGTVIQTQNIFAVPETVDNVETAETEEDADLILEIEDERTVVQTRPFTTEESVTEAPVSTAEIEADITPDITDADEVSTSEDSVTEAPVSIAEVEADITPDITDADEVSTSEDSVTEAPVSIAEVAADSTPDITDADEVSTSEESVTEAPVSIAEVEADITPDITDADEVSTSEESVTEASVSTAEVAADSTLEITPEITATDESSTLEKVAEVEEVQTVDNVEANTEIEASQMTIPKNIVLIAHETMKLELADLVAKHQEFFAQSVTVSWSSVSAVLEEQAGITVSEEIPAATSGGYQKINSLLNSGDILAMIFLRDFFTSQPGPINANEETLLRVCNINQVLVATNVKTAEAIIHYLQHIKG
jgi:methylglyoxal synthase